jgi:hypothetical protein
MNLRTQEAFGMKLIRLLTLLAAFAFGPLGATMASAQGLVNCAPSTPCNQSSGPSNTGTGDPSWKAFGKINGNFQSMLGATPLSIKSANFAATVANAPLVKNYQFGSSATGGPGITTITNQTDLANHFNAFEDFTALTTINSEFERYQPFNSSNHVFNASNLTLQALNPNNDWQVTAVSQTTGFTAGVATPIANLGLANTSAINLGQVAAVQGGGGIGGAYYVTAIVANTSVTLTALNGAPSPNTSTGLIFWLPVYGLALSAPVNVGATTMNFASVPSYITNGMQIGYYNFPVNGVTLNRDADYRVTNIVGGAVTFSPARGSVGNLNTGNIVWFHPVVTSGQIWSQDQFDLTNPNTFFAIEADLTLLGPGGSTRTAIALNGELTLSQFTSLPAGTPLGGWPAFWMYSADDGNSAAETGSASEVDFMEIQIGCTQDSTYLNTGAVTYSGAATIMQKTDSGWSVFAAFGISIAPSGTNFVGRNLYQWIFTNGMEYRFFNGILYKVRQFMWTGQRPSQFSVGIATGGMNAPLAANTIFPNNPAGFADIQLAINGIRVWYQAPPPLL